MEFDSQLHIQAMKQAESFYSNILDASRKPTVQIVGEALKIYNELEAWGWLEKYSIADNKNKWMYINMIAMQMYRHLKWNKDHPPKEYKKKSKWEIVHGASSKRG